MKDDDDDDACELVNGMELSIGEQPHHSIPAYLFKAVKNNNGTAILLLSDLFAFQHSSIRDFAYRLACIGFKYAAQTFTFNFTLNTNFVSNNMKMLK